jgi:hypothetical protein
MAGQFPKEKQTRIPAYFRNTLTRAGGKLSQTILEACRRNLAALRHAWSSPTKPGPGKNQRNGHPENL